VYSNGHCFGFLLFHRFLQCMNAVGETFRSARQQRNLSIDEVSKLTKIGVRVIESIEHGNFQALPPTYMRSFVRTYSQFLNIPEPELNLGDAPDAKRFQPQQTEQVSPLAMPENVFTPAYFSDQKRRNKRILAALYSVVGVLLAAVGFLVWTAPPVAPKPDDTMLTRPLRIIAEAVKPPSMRDTTAVAFVQSSDSMILEARALENAWLSIVMDRKRTDQFTMEAGKTYRWSAAKSFSFSLGNAGGVVFSLNGRELERFGETGVVVRDVRIQRDAVRGTTINSSSNPALSRILEAAPQQNTAQQNPSAQPGSQQPSVSQGTSAQGATPTTVPNSTQTIAVTKANETTTSPAKTALVAASSAPTSSNGAKLDSAKPRPRFVSRPKPQTKVLIDPVLPPLPAPKIPTTVMKPLDNKSGKNN